MPASIGQRHVSSGNAVDDERIDLALFLRLHPVVGIESTLDGRIRGDATSDFGREIFNFELCNQPCRIYVRQSAWTS